MSTLSLNPFQVRAKVKYTKGSGFGASAANFEFGFTNTISDGTTIGKVNRIYANTRTIADIATPDSVDLSGTLTDPLGDAAVFAKVNGLFIRNLHATAILAVGGGSNAFINWVAATGDIIKVHPGGVLMLWNPSVAGYAVTAATGDLLQVATDSGTAVQYELMVLGRNA